MASLTLVHLLVALFFFTACHHQALATLSSSFYSHSCPNLTAIVSEAVHHVVVNESRMCASLLRLHFHDCFVHGCDASILLDGSALEQDAFPNINSVRGYDVIDHIKAAVEAKCPGTVSCADILALVARDCVVELYGPSWTVYFGRRDSLNASQSDANSNLPPPNFNVTQLINSFHSKGLSIQDMVALSGAHTIGKAQCVNFKNRLYGPFQSGDQMNPSFNTSLQSSCPSSGGDSNLSPLDFHTEDVFDNKYFINMICEKGLLFSDQTLWSGGNSTTNSLVELYAWDQARFFIDFSEAMVKMGNINPLTGTSGEIRLQCGRVN